MRNGIKKYVIASLPIIFGCLFGFSYTDASTAWVNVPVGGEQIIDNSGIGIAPDNIGNFNGYSTDIQKNVIFWKNSSRFAFYYYTPDGIGYYNNAGGTPAYNNSRYGLVERYQITGYNNYASYNSNNFGYATGNTWEEVKALGLKPGDITDIAYVYPTNSTDRGYYVFGACLRSQNKDVSVCFWCNTPNNNCQLNTGADNIITYDNSSIAGFESIPDNYLKNSFLAGGGGETTINYACPTIQQLINTYPNQYNTGLCYSSSLIFSGGTIQQVEPKDIFTLYPQYTGFVADINLYNNYCVGPNTQTACETAFQGKTEQYTLISKIPDNVKKANLYAYCNLQLNYDDKNASTCVTSGAINTGEYIPPITNQGVIDELIDGDYNIVLPASGYVMDTLKDEDGERKIDWNIIESIQNLYSKFTTIFTGREGNNGIIPEYITRMILVIILFAFFKK